MSVLVYQMGKAGASSVIWAVRSTGMVVDRGGMWNIHELDKSDYSKIITLVRDPVHRNIAQVFSDWEKSFGYFPQRYKKSMMVKFKEEFNHAFPLMWLDYCFHPVWGIDVYRESFPKEKGWKIYDDKFLVLRTEDMSTVLDAALRSFLSIPSDRVIDVQHRNRGEISRGVAHGRAYAEFKRKTGFTEAFLDTIYKSRYMKHFYTEAEIAGFREMWKI